MKKLLGIVLLGFIFIGFTAMSAHRFYVAIYQVNYVPQKKELQITARIFTDDLNEALKKSYQKSTDIGSENESPEDQALMKRYLTEKFKISVNGQAKTMQYHSHEMESNVVVCYLTIKDLPRISKIEIENSVLTELHSEQQNIIQYNNNGKKQNLLLSSETTKGMLK